MLFTAVLATARSQSAPSSTSAGTTTDQAQAAPAAVIKADEAPAAPVVTRAKESSGAPKETLSVDFPDTDIREIVRNVADLFELNLVIPDSLQGKASIKLRDVTWRQIFEVVLKQVNYTFIEKDGIVKIVAIKDLQEEPYLTKTFSFENVSSSKILPLIVPMLTPKREATPAGANGQGGTPAQQGGSIVNSELSNELIVTDQSTVIARIGEMVKKLDVEPKQVVIETKFVEISKDNTKNREVAMGYRNTNTGLEGGTGLATPLVSPSSLNGFPFALGTGAVQGGSPTAVYNHNEFSALLNILNAATNVRLVTNPTIVAINGSKSEIKIGRDLQLVTITTVSSGSSPVTTASAGDIKFVGISLEVTPQITGNRLINLKVKPTKSSVFAEKDYNGNKFYDIDKREGDLNIILRDGQTAAIGGLVDTTTNRTETKVPLLGDIPLFGNLFKTSKNVASEINLVIFITASVLEPSKMKYDTVVSRDQLEGLDLTKRDILGKNYQRSDEENSLVEEVGVVRQNNQDTETIKRLNARLAEEKKTKK
ncbi:MAG TPA: secretin N-terminal domain-containing protein [Opitutaceae bacterium]|nr:secretin N-terminal domain-containing protein [Opitutaceae bacterium]HND60935.1 secretin N-terminal domain-containing protein [Opitutaceae bacterium]